MIAKPDSALVIIGHGSTENPDSSTPTWEQADEIRRKGIFREVACAFWKEAPSIPEVRYQLDSREVYVVPNFISEGYFTREVIPRELQLSNQTTEEVHGRTWHYCDPVGIHSSMTGLLLKRAKEVAPDVDPAETALIIVGHGTKLNAKSTEAIESQVALMKEQDTGYAEILDAYMEEPPLVEEWDKLATAKNVVVVPFFIADGLHSYQDIPVLLGINKDIGPAASQETVFRQNPIQLRGRNLYYSSAIGTEPCMTEVILDQVADFDARHSS